MGQAQRFRAFSALARAYQADPSSPIGRAALGAVGFGLALGGPPGVGGIPSLGFGPGTPLYAGANFADQFFGPLRQVGGLGPIAPLYTYYRSEVARMLARRGGLMTLFGGSTGGFGTGSFGGLGAGLADAVLRGTFGYLGAKQQTKQLRALAKIMGGGGISPYGFGGITPSAMSFAPGVPAAGAGIDISSILAGGLGALGGALGLGPDILPGGLEESGTGLFGPDLFSPTAASSRQNMIDAPHPRTGERVYWRPVGRPILFSGDAAVMRRAKKVCSRFMTRAGFGGAARVRRRFRRR